MRDLFILGLILAIPALAALGHDMYLAYNNTNLEVGERFYLSDLGWLWVNYSPETYNWVAENTDEAIWNGFIDPLLQESAFYIAAGPFAAFLIIIIFMKLFGVGAFEGRGLRMPGGGVKAAKKGDFSFGGKGSAKKKAKYKRK